MDDQRKALRLIVGECDSLLFHTRPNMTYRGLDSSALRNGIKIIRKIAADVQRQNTNDYASSHGTRKRS